MKWIVTLTFYEYGQNIKYPIRTQPTVIQHTISREANIPTADESTDRRKPPDKCTQIKPSTYGLRLKSPYTGKGNTNEK